MTTEQLTGLQLAVKLLAQIGNDDSDRAIAAVHDLADEHAQRLTLQHHASDQAQRIAELERHAANLVSESEAKIPAMQAAFEERLTLDRANRLLVAKNAELEAERNELIDQRDRGDAQNDMLLAELRQVNTERDELRKEIDCAEEAADVAACSLVREDSDGYECVSSYIRAVTQQLVKERDELRARLAVIEAQEPVAISKAGNLFWAGNPQDWRGVDCSLFARPGPAQAVPDADGARFRWLCEDHSDRETRERCRSLIDRLPVMSYSDAVMSIDEIMAAIGRHGDDCIRDADAASESFEALREMIAAALADARREGAEAMRSECLVSAAIRALPLPTGPREPVRLTDEQILELEAGCGHGRLHWDTRLSIVRAAERAVLTANNLEVRRG